MYISKSGVDKSLFTIHDFLQMNINGEKLPEFRDIKSSAETGIHLMLYNNTEAKTILHTHSIADTVLSRVNKKSKELRLTNYEVLKGIDGIVTHETEIIIPIFDNDQDIDRLSNRILKYIKNSEKHIYGFLIESHGFYTWGKSLIEAKRHLEVFQFLFSCELELLKIKK